MATRNTTKPKETALSTQVLSDDDLTAVLQELGLVETASTGDYPQRAKVEGNTIYLGDEMYTSNPKTGTPNMKVRLLGLPMEYQGVFIPTELAHAIGRPAIADKYCKSHFEVEEQKREYAQDGTACRGCPISPFTKRDNLPEEADGRKCQWRAEVSFQVLDAEGSITDPTVWTLDLSTTSVIEFKGTGRDPQAGSASDTNFVTRLARFGAESTPTNPNEGLRKALLAYRLGGVIAEIRQLPMRSPDGARSWYVTSFTPVDLIELEPETEALAIDEPAPATVADAEPTAPVVNDDDLPF